MAIAPAVDERQLILQLKRGQTDAAGRLMDHYGESLMRYLFSILGNREAAEDVFQESWVKVMQKIEQFHHEMAFAPWLFRIARNTAYDTLRTRKRWWSLDTGSGKNSEERVLDMADPTDMENQVVARQTAKALLKSLSPNYREVLFLRFLEDRSYEEIAGICGLPLGTVKSRLKRGLDYLARNLMEKDNHAR